MKDTPEVREKLQARIWQGADAEHLLKQLDPSFVELRERYRGALVRSVRTHAPNETIVQDAARITALEDLYETIYRTAAGGRSAQKKATALEESDGWS